MNDTGKPHIVIQHGRYHVTPAFNSTFDLGGSFLFEAEPVGDDAKIRMLAVFHGHATAAKVAKLLAMAEAAEEALASKKESAETQTIIENAKEASHGQA
jgi:hypothetical protein